MSNDLLEQVKRLPAAERIELMDEIHVSLLAEGVDLEVAAAQEAELEARLADHIAHPEDVVPWETVKANLERKFGFKL